MLPPHPSAIRTQQSLRVRAATTAFAKALAKEGAPFGIQANVVGPNYLYSEMYYPRVRFIDDPAVVVRFDMMEAGIAFLCLGRTEPKNPTA